MRSSKDTIHLFFSDIELKEPHMPPPQHTGYIHSSLFKLPHPSIPLPPSHMSSQIGEGLTWVRVYPPLHFHIWLHDGWVCSSHHGSNINEERWSNGWPWHQHSFIHLSPQWLGVWPLRYVSVVSGRKCR